MFREKKRFQVFNMFMFTFCDFCSGAMFTIDSPSEQVQVDYIRVCFSDVQLIIRAFYFTSIHFSSVQQSSVQFELSDFIIWYTQHALLHIHIVISNHWKKPVCVLLLFSGFFNKHSLNCHEFNQCVCAIHLKQILIRCMNLFISSNHIRQSMSLSLFTSHQWCHFSDAFQK